MPRSVLAMTAWLLKTRLAPSRHCMDARVYGHTTTVMHEMNTTPCAVVATKYVHGIICCCRSCLSQGTRRSPASSLWMTSGTTNSSCFSRRYCTLPTHTVLRYRIPYRLVPFSTAPHRIGTVCSVPYRTVPCRKVPVPSVQHHTVRCRTMCLIAVPYRTAAVCTTRLTAPHCVALGRTTPCLSVRAACVLDVFFFSLCLSSHSMCLAIHIRLHQYSKYSSILDSSLPFGIIIHVNSGRTGSFPHLDR